MRNLTQAEFDAMERNEDGYIVIPGRTDCVEIGFRGLNKIKLGAGCELGFGHELGDECELGDGCTLGIGCELGDWCTLGNGCTLGRGCTLGYGCKLGEFINVRATFEGGRVRNGLHLTVGNIGSEHRTAYFFIGIF